MNNFIISYKYIILLMLGFFMACKSDSIPQNPILEVEDSVLNFTNETNSKRVAVTTNLEEWTVKSSAEDWCKVTSKNQKNPYVLVLVEKNVDIEARECIITVSGEGQVAEFTVKQLGSAPAIILSQDVLEFTSDAGVQEVTMTTNLPEVGFEIVGDNVSWLVCEPADAEGTFVIRVTDNTEFEKRQAEIVFSSLANEAQKTTKSLRVIQKELSGEASDVDVPKDLKVKPTSGKANQFQPGQGIENSFDGRFNPDGAPYHSPWGDGTKLPVVLEYFFENNPEQIDYLIYYSRNGNGNFGEFNLYVATADNPDYRLYGKYNFEMKSAPSKVIFKEGLSKPTKIKFEVLSGAGGWVSCDEMEFYHKNKENALEAQLLTVFKDVTCSELNNTVSDAEIKSLPLFFGNIANQMKLGTYDKNFRLESYPAYSKVEEWAEKLIINPRNVLDNCTGIYVEGGKEIIVLVGNTHGNDIGLRAIGGTEYYGDDYFLQEGVNKITPRNTGLLYIMYNVSDITVPTAKPITIHIPDGCGVVNGYWDMKKHKTDEKYRELLGKATHEFFEVKGTDIMLKFPTSKFKEFVPNAILPSINFWDEMVQVEQSIMGWEDIYPKHMNNRMYARSTKDGYMSAQSYMTNFAENILYKILSPEKMLEDPDNPWGPAHEIGHMNQGAINWIGNTETSNNLFSNLVRHKMTNFLSRGETIEENVQAMMVEKRIYTTVGGDNQYDYGDIGYCSLRMNWQLYCYFHWLKNDEQFFPNVFKISRMDGRRPINDNPGWSQLNYVKNACDAAKLDLIEFFDFWGFLRPVDIQINQYGPAHLLVTDEMIKETIAYVKNKGYKTPKYPIQYIEDRPGTEYGDVGKIEQFKNQKKITTNITYSISGNRVVINRGSEAIGFEVVNDGKTVFFSNKFSFTIPEKVFNSNCEIYAVESGGKRILLSK